MTPGSTRRWRSPRGVGCSDSYIVDLLTWTRWAPGTVALVAQLVDRAQLLRISRSGRVPAEVVAAVALAMPRPSLLRRLRRLTGLLRRATFFSHFR